jgi:hypothetical protein
MEKTPKCTCAQKKAEFEITGDSGENPPKIKNARKKEGV